MVDSTSTTSEKPNKPITRFRLIKHKEVLIPLITAVLATYIHFWGYAYLKGKLQMVGLGDIEIQLSILESVYQASLSFRDIVRGVIGIELSTVLLTLVGVIAAFLLYALMFSIGDFIGDFIKEKKKQEPINKDASNNIIKSMKTGTTMSFAVCAVFVFLVFLFFVFSSTSSLLLNIPRSIGQATGKALIENPVCKPVPWKEMEKDRLISCTRIRTQDGEQHSGVIIFKNNQYTILVSNQKSLLLGPQNKIIAWSEVFERPDKTE